MWFARAIVAGLTFVSGTNGLLGQSAQNAVDVHGALGGAATGGGGADNGGAYGRVGMGIRIASTWRLNVDGAFFARLVNAECVTAVTVPTVGCGETFPATIAALLVGGAHSIPAPGLGDHHVTLIAGLGPSSVRSADAIAAEGGAQLDLLRRGRGAMTIDVRGMLLPNVHARTLWLVPMTIGFRY